VFANGLIWQRRNAFLQEYEAQHYLGARRIEDGLWRDACFFERVVRRFDDVSSGIDQGAVKVQENGARHDPKIAAETKRV